MGVLFLSNCPSHGFLQPKTAPPNVAEIPQQNAGTTSTNPFRGEPDARND